jgi:hypothetical protein
MRTGSRSLNSAVRLREPTRSFRLIDPPGARFVAVHSGGGANDAIDWRGGLWAWELNFEGELGDGARSLGRFEADLGQRAARDPFVEDGVRPLAVGTVALVEVLDEVGEDPPALGRVGDHGGNRR